MALFERPQPELDTEGDIVLRRVVAVLTDLILLGILTTALSAVLFQGSLETLGSVVGLLISLAYYIYLEGTYGQTLGKMVFDIVVVTEDGEPIDYGPATVRSVLRLVDVLPALYLLGFVVMLVTDRKQRIGDLVADTVVVRAR